MYLFSILSFSFFISFWKRLFWSITWFAGEESSAVQSRLISSQSCWAWFKWNLFYGGLGLGCPSLSVAVSVLPFCNISSTRPTFCGFGQCSSCSGLVFLLRNMPIAGYGSASTQFGANLTWILLDYTCCTNHPPHKGATEGRRRAGGWARRACLE
jgi:hypothetical protein